MKMDIFDDIIYVASNEELLSDITKYVEGTEGLGTIGLRILDSFISILNNLRATIRLPSTTVKRSEFKTFVQSNLIRVKLLNRKSYTDLHLYNIPVIIGMKVSYVEATYILGAILKELDIFSRSENALFCIKNISDTVEGETLTLTDVINQAANVYNTKLNVDIKKKIESINDVKSTVATLPFADVFKSMTEFHTVYDTVYDMADQYNTLSHITSMIDRIQDYTNKIIATVKHKRLEFTKADLVSMSNVVYLYANMFDVYGLTIARQHNLDHSFTEVCKSLLEQLS